MSEQHSSAEVQAPRSVSVTVVVHLLGPGPITLNINLNHDSDATVTPNSTNTTLITPHFNRDGHAETNIGNETITGPALQSTARSKARLPRGIQVLDNNGGIRARKSEINSAAGDDTDSPTEDETEDETEERKRRLDLDSRAAPSKRQRR